MGNMSAQSGGINIFEAHVFLGKKTLSWPKAVELRSVLSVFRAIKPSFDNPES
mgnify:CR=1 FL=1